MDVIFIFYGAVCDEVEEIYCSIGASYPSRPIGSMEMKIKIEEENGEE